MAMTAEEAFKVGAVHACLHYGVPVQKIAAVVDAALQIKRADPLKAVKMLGSGLGWLGTRGGLLAAGTALAGPPALSYMAGRAIGGVDAVDNQDVEEVKHRELLRSIKDETDNLKQEKELRDYQAQQRKPSRFRV